MSYWTEIPGHPVEDWKNEVANDDTLLGYHEWVRAREAFAEMEK